MSHERTPVTLADATDLDRPAFEAFVARRAPSLSLSEEELAVRLGLLARMGARAHPTPVGLLLFGRAPQLFHPEWGLSLVAVRGGSLADPIVARADLEGPLGALLAGALAFVREHGGSDLDPARPDVPLAAYPEDAARELVVNALVHRDLRRPMRVAVRVLSDRLEITSPGGLPEGLGDGEEALETGGLSLPRNPILAATARALGLGEQVGRGLVVARRAGRAELEPAQASVTARLPSRVWARRQAMV